MNIDNNIIFDTIDNGIIILDENLNIKAWNKWLEVKTSIKEADLLDKNICEEFPYINEKRLKRKIKSVLVTKSASYFSIEPHEYLIQIKSNILIGKIFEYMRQNITIVPYDTENNIVCLYIYDHTKLYESNEKLKNLNEELKELSTKDFLTQLYNRRYFSETSSKMLNLSIRNSDKISIILCDIDNFKEINDTYGHGIGDKVIVSLANILKDNSRQTDIIARYGGEEFILLLYNTEIKYTEKIAENIRKIVEKIEIITNKNRLKYTLSLGIAEFNATLDNDLEATINRADKALYKAKINGKNRVEIGL